MDYQGNVIQTLPLTSQFLTLGDPDNDSIKEIGFLAQGGYHLFEMAGFTELPNFPVDFAGTNYEGWAMMRALFADIGGTSQEEVVSGSSCCGFVPDGMMFAVDLDAAISQDFPLGPYLHRGMFGTYPAISDLDGDGDLEICQGSRNDEFTTPRTSTVYCWDVPHPYNLDNIDRAMDGFALQHTGRWRKLYCINKISSTLTVEDCTASPCTLPADGKTRVVTVTATREADGTHPAGQDVRYSRTLGCGDYSGPVIDNGDGTYTRMLQAPTIGCTTDLHAWVNEFKLADSATINFVDCLSNLGDVNLNGQISALDASLILQAVVGLISLDPVQQCLADVNENGLVSSLDAAYVLMCTVGNCPGLPAGFLPSCTAHDNCL